MSKSLIPTKFNDFGGLERNSNQPNRNHNLRRMKNVVSNDKPGTLTIRDGYELRYTRPTDQSGYSRLENTSYVSFDNFFERTAGQGTEITCLVEKSEIVAPTIDGNKLNDYKFRAANIWIRPYWKGSYWVDQWQWLNESYITNITVAPDATYKNKLQFEGYFDNLSQWTVVNVSKDSTLPFAVLHTKKNGTNTDFWMSGWDLNWEVDDIIVLFRNYIPIATQIANYDVLRKEISFHRILSNMRIGFGGKENRLGYAVQYLKQTLQLQDYDWDDVDPEILNDEYIFATGNKVVLTPYTQFNDNQDSFNLLIETDTGDFPAGEYYFRMTVVLDGTTEVLVVQHKETIDTASQFFVKPQINLGNFNRRITATKVYFSETGDDYYFVQEFTISIKGSSGTLINSPTWYLLESGWLTAESLTTTPPDQHVESNAASSDDANDLGSWFGYGNYYAPTMSVVAASNFAIQAVCTGTYKFYVAYPCLLFDPLIKAEGKYTITVNVEGSTDLKAAIILIYNSTEGYIKQFIMQNITIPTTYASQSFDVEIPSDYTNNNAPLIYFAITRLDGTVVLNDEFRIEEFILQEQGTVGVDVDLELGSSMLDELGYQATFNLVRDWMQGIVRNGITWLAGAYFKGDGRYDNKIFGSYVSGLSANMHDAIPAQKLLDVDRFKGEVVVGMALLPNNTLVILKDGIPIIADPETGQIYESQRGDGCVIKNSILVIRSTLYWQSREDVLKMSAATGYDPEPISDRYVRDILKTIADKTTAHACLDKYGSYRIALVDDKNGVEFPELVLTNRGWADQVRYHHPEVYRNGLGGRVWFMNEGDIYAFPFDEEEFIGYADVYGNYNSGW